ncbi:MAG: hypothetical protein COW84_06895 [Gammaproteobacteria bacterium CG22_combo_CG10-13_8_21_14_all_40_8]|nr:MAG: hypothetical protein COW84_06895 [Gammaproteobacteria bacterium CG22_combo_CG10-13_8_21_14_all_40_8]
MNTIMTKNALLIGTCGIDCYFGLEAELKLNKIEPTLTKETSQASAYLQANAYDLIMVNLEPDGRGGIAGSEIMMAIANNSKQQNAVCLSISTRSAASPLSSHPEQLQQLSIIAGWINLPIQHHKAAVLMRDIIDHPGALTVKARLHCQSE